MKKGLGKNWDIFLFAFHMMFDIDIKVRFNLNRILQCPFLGAPLPSPNKNVSSSLEAQTKNFWLKVKGSWTISSQLIFVTEINLCNVKSENINSYFYIYISYPLQLVFRCFAWVVQGETQKVKNINPYFNIYSYPLQLVFVCFALICTRWMIFIRGILPFWAKYILVQRTSRIQVIMDDITRKYVPCHL